MTDIATIGDAFATAELWHIIAPSLSVGISAGSHRRHPLGRIRRVLQVFGASKSRAVRVLINMGRAAMLTAVLAGFGRTISEVGAIVGGDIAGYARTMTTA
ncbi:MAG: hypothetical protein WAV02_12315 [Stellaceae bacterium]